MFVDSILSSVKRVGLKHWAPSECMRLLSMPLKEKRRTVKNVTVFKPYTQGDPGTLQRSLIKLTLSSYCTVESINFQMWRSRVYAKNQLHVSRADVCVSRNDLLKLPQASTVI